MIARGRVEGARGGLVSASLPNARIGDAVSIATLPEATEGYVCAIDGARALIAMHAGVAGIARGATVRVEPSGGRVPLGSCALGRALDARGRPLDGGPRLVGRRVVPAIAPLPDRRVAVSEPLWTGVRAIDALLTIGRGARIGIFGAPGAGKSSLLEAIVANCDADAVVVALVGERGREARRWIDLRRPHATVVCATSDRPPAERVNAALLSVAHAAALRDGGLDVLLVLDSLARVAAAAREIAVAAGESVGRGGYPPSVFADLARLVEIAGPTRCGSLTLIASVLSDGEDGDPVSDAARSLLDGHVALAMQLAQAGRFPAIDVLTSASRTMAAVVGAAQLRAAARVRGALALLERTEDARRLGIEPAGARDRHVVAQSQHLETFLRQGAEAADPAQSLRALAALAAALEDALE